MKQNLKLITLFMKKVILVVNVHLLTYLNALSNNILLY